MKFSKLFELGSYLAYHKQLNPKLFDGDVLRPEVRNALLRIADEWRHFSKIPQDAVSDIIFTGGNCIPLDQHVWTKNLIQPLYQIQRNDLFNSTIIKKFPVNQKKKYKITLVNGQVIYSSSDHRYPVVSYLKYISSQNEMSVEEMMNSSYDALFLEVPKGNNINPNNDDYTDIQLYLAGLIYTDGSLKDKNNPLWGYSFFQSDLNLMNVLTNLGIDSKITSNKNGGYSRYIHYKHLQNTHELIFNGPDKDLNVVKLSSLSKRQFLIFFSGLLDGDGYFSNGKYCFCNFNNDINDVQELLLWNGIFSQTNSINRLRLYSKLDNLTLRKEKRWYNKIQKEETTRKSKQPGKNIKFKEFDNYYLVRIKSIEDCYEFCEMMDIETDTHYFISNGIKTHNCNYNYTRFSDIDLHLVVKKKELGHDSDFLDDYLSDKKSLWAAKHHIIVKGYSVEMYAQDEDDNLIASGVYSVLHNKWLFKPVHGEYNFNKDEALISKIAEWKDTIQRMIDQDASEEEFKNIKRKLKEMRAAGLESGEFGFENLVWKGLRNSGIFDKMNRYLEKKEDKEFSLD